MNGIPTNSEFTSTKSRHTYIYYFPQNEYMREYELKYQFLNRKRELCKQDYALYNNDNHPISVHNYKFTEINFPKTAVYIY